MKSLMKKLTKKVIAPLLITGTLLAAPMQKLDSPNDYQNKQPQIPKTSFFAGIGSYGPNSSSIRNYYGSFFKISGGVLAEFPNNLGIKGSFGHSGKKKKEYLDIYGGVENRLDLFQIDALGNYTFPITPGLNFYLGAGVAFVGARENVYSINPAGHRKSKISSNNETAFGFAMSSGMELYPVEGSAAEGLFESIFFEYFMRHAQMGEDKPNLGGGGFTCGMSF